ncbi:hypothetical protein XELAEV_18019782mg [Xenopus laevis]|uniref:Uncharacterized protein n=1 Tax=Xenopus laevis TaxID=8355 RepID=A0A974HQD3_XENLA|nr:hypothetical protein XELAEV_18019782mg [Xenopus laevis]
MVTDPFKQLKSMTATDKSPAMLRSQWTHLAEKGNAEMTKHRQSFKPKTSKPHFTRLSTLQYLSALSLHGAALREHTQQKGFLSELVNEFTFTACWAFIFSRNFPHSILDESHLGLFCLLSYS